MVNKWSSEFYCGCISPSNGESSGRPIEVATSETNEAIHDMVLAVRELKVVDGRRYMHKIWFTGFNFKWSLHYEKAILNRVVTSKECVSLFNRNPDKFVCRFITVDQMNYTTTHQRSSSIKNSEFLGGELAPKNSKVVCHSTKARDARGIIQIDYFQSWRTISGYFHVIVFNMSNYDLRKTTASDRK